jgi:hypothetical protein
LLLIRCLADWEHTSAVPSAVTGGGKRVGDWENRLTV